MRGDQMLRGVLILAAIAIVFVRFLGHRNFEAYRVLDPEPDAFTRGGEEDGVRADPLGAEWWQDTGGSGGSSGGDADTSGSEHDTGTHRKHRKHGHGHHNAAQVPKLLPAPPPAPEASLPAHEGDASLPAHEGDTSLPAHEGERGEGEEGEEGETPPAAHALDDRPPCASKDVSPTMCARVTDNGRKCESGDGWLAEACPWSCRIRCDGVPPPDPVLPAQAGITPLARLARMPGADADDTDGKWLARQAQVQEAFNHSWAGYVKYAWGFDTLKPVSMKRMDNMGGLGATIVDSIDTMLVMGWAGERPEEYERARGWIRDKLSFNRGNLVSTFETIIRVLGGLLAAHDLAGEDQVFLNKARVLGETLLQCFGRGASGMPFPQCLMGRGVGHPSWSSKLAEVGTCQLEFFALSERLGDDRWARMGSNIVDVIERMDHMFGPQDHLRGVMLDQSGKQMGPTTIGADADSYFEYLLKVWVYGGRGDKVARYKSMWDDSMKAAAERIIGRSLEGFKFIKDPPTHGNNMGHLTCFVPGMLALGAHHTPGELGEQLMGLAKDLGETCYMMYHRMPTGLSPENAVFDGDWNSHIRHHIPPCYMLPPDAREPLPVGGEEQTKPRCEEFVLPMGDWEKAKREQIQVAYPQGSVGARDPRNFQRPETVESLFYLWRLTGDDKYREWGWEIFESFERATKVESGGYSGLKMVTANFTGDEAMRLRNMDDEQQTFWLAETLKYLYLLFSPRELIPLDEWTFNTEAHPIKMQPEEKSGHFKWAGAEAEAQGSGLRARGSRHTPRHNHGTVR